MSNWIDGPVDTSKMPKGLTRLFWVKLSDGMISIVRYSRSSESNCTHHMPYKTGRALLDGEGGFTPCELKEIEYMRDQLCFENPVALSIRDKINVMLNPQPELPEILDHPDFGECELVHDCCIRPKRSDKGVYRYMLHDNSLSKYSLIKRHNKNMMKSLKEASDDV